MPAQPSGYPPVGRSNRSSDLTDYLNLRVRSRAASKWSRTTSRRHSDLECPRVLSRHPSGSPPAAPARQMSGGSVTWPPAQPGYATRTALTPLLVPLLTQEAPKRPQRRQQELRRQQSELRPNVGWSWQAVGEFTSTPLSAIAIASKAAHPHLQPPQSGGLVGSSWWQSLLSERASR